MKTFVGQSILAFALMSGFEAGAQPIDYRFEAVKRNVTLHAGQTQQPAAAGLDAHSGDRVLTGWFSSATLVAEKQRAKFEIFSAADVTLAGGAPGVLLTVERGRIRAAFDKIVGSEPRVVKTPGALLAVRGTQFDVEVDANGNTVVAVFEGLVEVQSPLRPEPLFVRPGEQSTFGRRTAPRTEPMSDDRRRHAPEGTIPRDDMRQGRPGEGRAPEGRPDGMRPGSTQPGGRGPGTMTPPAQPPHGGAHPPQKPPAD